MLPPRLIRRLALVPLVVVIAACLVVLTPPVALLSAASGLVRRLTGRGHRPRLLRVVFLALTWSVGETAALTVLLGLWIVSGFGGRLDTEPYRTRHYAVMEWFLNLIYRVARRACGLRSRWQRRRTSPWPMTARSSCSAGTLAPATRCCSSTTCSRSASGVPGSS